MEKIGVKENELAIKKLHEGIDRSWDLFIYGDKEHGIKPGRVEVYGAIAGMREVGKQRVKLRETLENEKEEE